VDINHRLLRLKSFFQRRAWGPGCQQALPGSQSGFSLIEVLLASFIIITVGVGLLAALSLSSRVVLSTDNSESARDLAVAQMEYIKSLDYNASQYAYNPDLLPGGSQFSVSVATPQSLQDGNLQKITVIIARGSREVFRLSDYKVKW
jgi:Tfp pilus assembly protein PilV